VIGGRLRLDRMYIGAIRHGERDAVDMNAIRVAMAVGVDLSMLLRTTETLLDVPRKRTSLRGICLARRQLRCH